jgi:hypothetical protein
MGKETSSRYDSQRSSRPGTLVVVMVMMMTVVVEVVGVTRRLSRTATPSSTAAC